MGQGRKGPRKTANGSTEEPISFVSMGLLGYGVGAAPAYGRSGTM